MLGKYVISEESKVEYVLDETYVDGDIVLNTVCGDDVVATEITSDDITSFDTSALGTATITFVKFGKEFTHAISVVSAEEAALQAKKDRAISAINNYYDTLLEINQYTDANKAALLEAKNNALAAINAATTIEEVNTAATAGQNALDAVEKIQPTPEPQPEPQPGGNEGGESEQPSKKGGCGGSIIGTSVVLSLLSLAGVTVLALRKRD